MGNLKRQLPDVAELLSLMKFKLPSANRRAVRLAAAADVWDLRTIAKRRTPTAAFDYVDGAAGREITATRARQVFHSVELLPRILHGTAHSDLSTTIAGAPSALPFGIAPTGFTRFMHSEGEIGGSRAAQKAGIPFSLSTMGTRSIEEVAAAAPEGRKWFQLYLWKDREKSKKLVERAAAAGFDTLLVTVDTPVAGQRLRDARNGMKIPPELTLKTVLDASYRPEWWYNFLTTDSLKFASLSDTSADLPTIINSMFDSSLDFEDLRWIRELWKGKLFVKGVLTTEDAAKAKAAGADGLVVSNHGGRQLDRAPIAFEALSEVRAEVGPEMEIIMDSGIMSGADIVAALCAGADFVLIGRAYLYGLMAGGEEGVSRAIELLAKEVEVNMQLMGAASIKDLDESLIRRRS
ncbi:MULTISPECIES: alpha-hydroxy acid oxidase [Glutamicibacter]|uniref:L-lactate dehydrogenase (Cytochrome) n=1 Tax=Glutamicibacter arilaitensis (strain DSM 16368 / CIP 108037 / IAM 15318 / JCM 13566 / NCIMB 14258 / Re117) TaxID=861360 RepID=A0ABP1U8U2_GLUAR|nr:MULTISPECIES: alpha-hydroxy acid oxidase [Glutamicibacter]CBT77309.1 L-lactate dehydrogenase (cytochrome) [Glutamicibacter arilaitensis Re117]HCH48788.1 alpha-hydroxy-acid oxidizing protein [Glutamicibacter sp.]